MAPPKLLSVIGTIHALRIEGERIEVAILADFGFGALADFVMALPAGDGWASALSLDTPVLLEVTVNEDPEAKPSPVRSIRHADEAPPDA